MKQGTNFLSDLFEYFIQTTNHPFILQTIISSNQPSKQQIIQKKQMTDNPTNQTSVHSTKNPSKQPTNQPKTRPSNQQFLNKNEN